MNDAVSFNNKDKDKSVKHQNKSAPSFWMENLIRAIEKQEQKTPGFKHDYIKGMKNHASKKRIPQEQVDKFIKKHLK